MLLQLNGVGKQKISYKDHKNINFDGLYDYITMAKKAIAKFSNRFYHGLSNKMLKDEDAVASVANAIMMADWRWDENYQNAKGTKKSRYSYRNQCALWAIQTYVSKDKKKNTKIKSKIYSLDFIVDDEDGSESMQSLTRDINMLTPDQIVSNQEDKQQLSQLIDGLLSLDCLTPRQKEYIRLYYFESYTFEKIGKQYGITREAVRQGLNKALEIIRGVVNE